MCNGRYCLLFKVKSRFRFEYLFILDIKCIYYTFDLPVTFRRKHKCCQDFTQREHLSQATKYYVLGLNWRHKKVVELEVVSVATLGGFPAKWEGKMCFGRLVVIWTTFCTIWLVSLSPDKKLEIQSSESASSPLQVLLSRRTGQWWPFTFNVTLSERVKVDTFSLL